MSRYLYIFFASILLTTINCKQGFKFVSKGNFLTPGAVNPLKGNVMSLFEMNFASSASPLNVKDSFYLNDTDSLCFDTNGNITYEMYRIVKMMDSERTYKFDENGVHLSASNFADDSLVGRMNSVSKKIAKNQIETITYKNDKPSQKSIYTYDKNSYIIEQRDYLIEEGKEVFKLHHKLENKNDGRTSSADFYDMSGKKIGHYQYIYGIHYAPDTIKILDHGKSSIRTYKFDSNGNPLQFMIDGVIQDRYEYEYDNFGNWIKRKHFNDDKLISYQLRRYYYRY
jgi:hypothetical protein